IHPRKSLQRDLVAVIVNCRSIVNKVDEFASLLESVKADIVFGTESWLDASIRDSEVFPKEFIAYRKDRSRFGGGVFLLVSQKAILLGGDFNLPDLHWGDGICVTTTGCGIDIEMKSIIDTFGLVQYVQEPTRDKNVLDLFFSNSPDQRTSAKDY
ncbi:uncharacterized protein LOC144098031, partial [Amblyomma americanum]